jgi:hypothetical protein
MHFIKTSIEKGATVYICLEDVSSILIAGDLVTVVMKNGDDYQITGTRYQDLIKAIIAAGGHMQSLN